jgi:homoserine kinase type II
MAVFTEVSFDEAQSLVARLRVGTLQRLAGITAGIENTNYFVTTDRGEYVLTLFERLTFEQLPFYLHLMKHLAMHGIPVPEPQGDARGEILHALNGKPAALVDKLGGGHQLAPDIDHCEQVGAMLAAMHLAGRDFGMHQPNLRGLDWWVDTVPAVRPHVTPEQAALLDSELAFQRTLAASPAHASLPRGPIHADLFRDNVMFDLDTGRLVEERAAAFVAAYTSRREWDSAEYRLLPALMRAAAFRFWLSRLWDLHLPRDAALLKAHDPEHFERVLRERIARPWHPAVA